MIATVAARRSAGDWRGVCAAGGVDAHIDLRDVAARYGRDEAARIEADLIGFAPDLLRRYLPRMDNLALVPQLPVVLSRRATPVRMAPAGRGTPVLVATLPHTERARQRLALRVEDVGTLQRGWYDLPDWCWHADAVTARRWACGVAPDRLAWHTADGRPYPPGTPFPPGPPVDRAAEVETIAGRLGVGHLVPAYEAAGFAVDLTDPPRWWSMWPVELLLGRYAATLPVLAAEVRRLAHRYGATTLASIDGTLTVDVAPDGGLTVRRAPREYGRVGPYAFGLPAPADVALLRHGRLHPDELHPLVHAALLPDRVQSWRAPTPAARRQIRIRCGPDWHLVEVSGGRIRTPHHSAEELHREFLLAGLGGPVAGCAAAVRAWRTGATPVPKEIRRIRRDIFALALHGDTDGLLAVLSEGRDAGLRDGRGGTLLHWVSHVDHTRVLPVLLAAGLSLVDRDRDGGTPLHAAAATIAVEVMTALVEAGADPEAVDGAGRTPAEVLARARRAATR
ncbi:ankyrin repeat domain-containing protein [Micromonospora sp. CPCC 206060]|uniref:ankyrin repeat domain-containing protein n=1 Tax=Micromonospora sp. CPCC 206060 TaxID=3122406 RepID=UPI002FF01E4C